jgi:prepilin-type N-terminal cleavage/methylation domain-containing protein
MHTQRNRSGRPGFTLIELLVVMAIIALLAALVIAFFPSIASQTSEAQGAANFQSWLNIARQKALRNQQPFGLRLWVSSQNINTLWVTDCQYIEQPDDWPGNTGTSIVSTAQTTVPNDTVTLSADVTGGFGGGSDPAQWPVQIGDSLEVLGSGLMHRILNINGTTNQLVLNSGLPFAVSNATNFRILRQPRVVPDDPTSLPSGVVVDLATNNANGNPLPITPVYALGLPPPVNPPTGYYVDVLFSPSGAVITPGLTTNYMAFFVRLPDPNNPNNAFYGTPSVIAVWSQSGLVGAYNPTPGNPYVDVH